MTCNSENSFTLYQSTYNEANKNKPANAETAQVMYFTSIRKITQVPSSLIYRKTKQKLINTHISNVWCEKSHRESKQEE